MTTAWESMAPARARIRERVEQQKRQREQHHWLTNFNRMVRIANWRANVEHRWP